MTRHRQPVPARPPRPLDPEGPFLCALRRPAHPPHPRRGVPGGGPSPRRTGRMDRPEARGADGAAMPGGQARMSGTPPRRRSKRSSHSCLTACPAPRPPATGRGGWWDAPSARAASLASSAALPRPPDDAAHRARLRGRDPYVNLYVNPYVIPYARGVRTLGFGGRGYLSSSGPPRGEWSGQAEWMRFAQLIDRPVRVLGGPAVRATYGGSQTLPWWPLSVACVLTVPFARPTLDVSTLDAIVAR